MTGKAVTRRSFQHTIDVTRLATRGHMHPAEGKPGLQVVKIALRGLRLQSSPHRDEKKCRKHSKHMDKQARDELHHRKTPFLFNVSHQETRTPSGVLPCPKRRWNFFQLSVT